MSLPGLALPGPHLVEQAGVFQRDGDVAGEAAHHLHLLRIERLRAAAFDDQRAEKSIARAVACRSPTLSPARPPRRMGATSSAPASGSSSGSTRRLRRQDGRAVQGRGAKHCGLDLRLVRGGACCPHRGREAGQRNTDQARLGVGDLARAIEGQLSDALDIEGGVDLLHRALQRVRAGAHLASARSASGHSPSARRTGRARRVHRQITAATKSTKTAWQARPGSRLPRPNRRRVQTNAMTPP